MKIYISGKITGLEFLEAKYLFDSAAMLIIAGGNNPVNPVDIKPLFGIYKYCFHMIADVWALMFCDAIYMLKNWNDSRGAKIEHWVANFLSIEIIYE